MAELRHVEAQLEEVRVAHYASSDRLHGSQGELAQAQLEVSRLEERIRYVVEGRQRAEARPGKRTPRPAQASSREMVGHQGDGILSVGRRGAASRHHQFSARRRHKPDVIECEDAERPTQPSPSLPELQHSRSATTA